MRTLPSLSDVQLAKPPYTAVKKPSNILEVSLKQSYIKTEKKAVYSPYTNMILSSIC